ncbi:MAG: hypothetical protein ABJZ55_03030 [Fuerstiella sp.]
MAKKKAAPKKKATNVKKKAAKKKLPAKKYQTVLDFGEDRRIKDRPAQLILELEKELGKRVVLFCHKATESNSYFDMITPPVRDLFLTSVRTLPKNEPVAVLVDSPGGMPASAYQIARGLQNHCGGFDVVVPKYAKSAATLLSLGADSIYMSDCAELGPIDMQVADADTEEQRSVLEYVQSLERLEAYTLRFLDDAMTLLLHRTHKKIGTLLPISVEMATSVSRPLFENIDVVQYTQMARLQKVMEDYASRLLSRHVSPDIADSIAADLTSGYSDHGFVIDKSEALNIGLPIAENPQAESILQALAPHVDRLPNLLGPIEETH